MDDDESYVYAKGRSVQVFFDYKKNTVLPVPQDIREKLSEFSFGKIEK